jgi:hypothetical protein
MVFPRSHLARTAAALAAAGTCLAVGVAGATEAPPADVRPCKALEIPAKPSQRVWCTTPNAALVIAHQSDPVLIDGTEIRVLSGRLLGTTVTVRLRVRNGTDAEQGVGAGGQELYLYLDGARIDVSGLGDVRLDLGEAQTIELSYALTPAQVAALRAAGGRVDFGVRPWHDGVAPAPLVGVVRMRVGG